MRSYKHRKVVALPTRAEVLNCWNAGMNTWEIAKHFDVAESYIYNMLAKERA